MPKAINNTQLKEKLRAELKKDSENNECSNASHPFLAQGAQSIVLHDGDDHILLIAPIEAARGIECLRDAFNGENETNHPALDIPALVGLDMDINKLINSADLKEGKDLKLSSNKQSLWKENVVYRLPKYKNNLEEFKRHKFDPIHIEQIENTITDALTALHAKNLSHNDIALRNIFYTGIYPNFKFYLGDFGSVKSTQHVKKTNSTPTKDEDFYNLDNLVLSKLRMIKRTPTPQQNKSVIREAGKRRVKGVKRLDFGVPSPMKAFAPLHQSKVSLKNRCKPDQFSDIGAISPIATRKHYP